MEVRKRYVTLHAPWKLGNGYASRRASASPCSSRLAAAYCAAESSGVTTQPPMSRRPRTKPRTGGTLACVELVA